MKHQHAELAALYAEDMMKSKTPWENWETKTTFSDWVSLLSNPTWSENQEYRRKLLTQKQVEEGWIEHVGSSCPVDKNSYPEILLKSGRATKGLKASSYDWRKPSFFATEIVAYKPVKTPLSRDDIPLASLIFDGHIRKLIVEVGGDGVLYCQNVDTDKNIHFVSYQDMMSQGWKINKFNQRDKDGNPTAWSPCYK